MTKFRIATKATEMKLDDICDMLWRSYWAEKRSKEAIEKSINNSCCIGIFDGDRQIAFTRIITDYTTFAYICDVIVHEDYRGQGLGKDLMRATMSHLDLQDIEMWSLATRDAHGLYEQFGFKITEFPNNRLEIRNRPGEKSNAISTN